MAKYASAVVTQARAWLGCKESNDTHKVIIDVYNSHKPLARGYTVKYTDAWCATFVSAVAIKLGYTDIIPTECGCGKMIDLFKAIGSWKEGASYKPSAGDIIFYDWNDNNSSDHVGIVEKISGSVITVIEGNKNNAVERREISIGNKCIQGYGVPKYDAAVQQTVLPKPSTRAWQRAAVADGFAFPIYGIDGEWGSECEGVARKAVVKRGGKYRNLNKFFQAYLHNIGYDMSSSRKKDGTFDGIIGSGSEEAIKDLQRALGFISKDVDGEIGIKTCRALFAE